ncbi:hypothetical protein SNE25_15745 [Mucilaginibacter sabulilitoris]|uniref:SPW repeat-containing protein n=1 Tax=Mucilaginibacter sabulilitoris TaxID=1173583 RepID=A0ABZ0TV35_9SPHI|nr:hypothetical protein [Mucilaginibacter sabulilitoris]WPU96974.1 hypothetical protein SNE25_15745 [Mucilaginibacter sabulilitoris]
MKLRFISPGSHGIIDYVGSIALIACPFILKLGDSPAIKWVSIGTGLAGIAISILTKYEYSIFKVIPFDLHLAINLAAATAFVAIPFTFDLKGLDAMYFFVNAVIVYLVVALTENRPAE